ncbi:MAG: hypothetical protein Q9226_009295, partial [Calogaya cf. arnoldii]
MSGVSGFVGGRQKSSNDEQPAADLRERAQVRALGMGVRSQLLPNTAEDRSTKEKKKERVSSRQDAADRARVSTPPFPLQRVPLGSDAATQRIKSTTGSVGHAQLPIHGPSSAQPKTHGLFDTDSEAADETTRFSALTEPDNLPVGHTGVSADRVYPESMLRSHGPSRLSRESLDYDVTDHSAGAQQHHQMNTGSDDDGDDEFDDQTQYENVMLDENQTLDRQSP